ncbi:endonuclease/exonuclease/phosphatase family protein [Kitasatospora sp. DSM 101779]|uniref:endonuclease/exonuclease/phosphatase family protein n=1 Tax=Kitasatospora sp. DSM 101779 TaxID=2853165 RepID=UPI00398637C4
MTSGRAGGEVVGNGADTLTVASLNVCCGVRNTLHPLRERAAEICARIERMNADVVNLQEVWTPGLLAFLRARLPSHPFLARRPGLLGQPAGGLVAFSRMPLRSAVYRSFRSTRAHRGGLLFRAGAAAGAALQGVLTYELAGRRTVVGNTHLTANHDGDWSPGNRHEALQRAQVAAVHEALRRARRSDTRLSFLVGDFNAPSSSGLYRAIVDGGTWRDPFAAADLPTFQTALLPDGARAHRVDYVLVQGSPEHHPVTGTDLFLAEPVPMRSGPAAYVSDHLGQLVRVGVPEAAAD